MRRCRNVTSHVQNDISARARRKIHLLHHIYARFGYRWVCVSPVRFRKAINRFKNVQRHNAMREHGATFHARNRNQPSPNATVEIMQSAFVANRHLSGQSSPTCLLATATTVRGQRRQPVRVDTTSIGVRKCLAVYIPTVYVADISACDATLTLTCTSQIPLR